MGFLDGLKRELQSQQENLRRRQYENERNAYREYANKGREMSKSDDANLARKGRELQEKATERERQLRYERQEYLRNKREQEIYNRVNK